MLVCLGDYAYDLCLAAGSTPPATPAVSSATFPLSWQGQWKGDVEVLGADFGKFSMELVIAPTSDANTFDWKIIYDGQAGRQEGRAMRRETTLRATGHLPLAMSESLSQRS